MGSFLIYAVNIIGVNLGIIIPINIFTIGFTAIFDISGVLVLIVLKTMGV
jgi:hypothetical protein